jgi:hypothetical protein
MDKANGKKDDLIRYYNFYMINQGTVYERNRYNFMILFGEIGGLITILTLAA